MPEAVYSTTVDIAHDRVWDFVRDMNNWAPMLTGYQKHEIKSDAQSIWTLKGDVGILSRTVQLDVNITEWSAPNRVTFTLRGINEIVEGEGSFTAEIDDLRSGGVKPSPQKSTFDSPTKRCGWRRVLAWVVPWLFRLTVGKHKAPIVRRVAGSGKVCRLTFRLRMDAGGPTGPLVNAMLEPALLPATQDLAEKVASHLISACDGV